MIDDAQRQLLLDNPALFIVRYFPHRVRKLEDFHIRLIETATIETRGLILYPATHGKCLSLNTPVLLRDGTLRRAADVQVGDELATGTCEVSESNGINETVLVTLRTGQEITTTPNHPFLLETGEWKNAADLRAGDECVLLSEFEAPGTDLPLTAFRLLGYFIGDGCVTGTNCRLTSADPEIVADFTRCLESLGFKRGATQDGKGRAAEYSAIGGCREWLKSLGAHGQGSHAKRVPEAVFRGTNEQIRHFLAAYFSCDGSFSRGTSGFEFYSVSQALLKDVQHLLLRLGVAASLSLKNGRYKGARHISWRLRVPSAGFDEIRQWPIVLDRKIPPRIEQFNRFLPTVVSVEPAGAQETWALQVSSGTHYTADVLTHNTTIVSTLLPIWRICKDPNVRIVIIGKNDTETEGIMAVIQAELTDNQELIRDFGPFKPEPSDDKPWALGRMSVAKRTRRAKEPTITVFGSGAKTVLGYRTDLTICDDVVTEKNSSTPEQRKKIRDWFDLCVETGPEHQDSQLIVVGTRFDPADLYGDLIEMQFEGGNLWKVQLEDAIVDEEEHRTLWPERWPWKRLMQQKAKVGTLNFNKRYRNIAVDASRMVFKEEYVKGGWIRDLQFPGCLDRSYVVGDFGDNWKRVAGFDPAVGGTRSAKFCAHCVLAAGSCVDHALCFWVVDLERAQLTLPQQVEMIIGKHEQYGLLASVLEANSYQAGLYQEVDRKLREQDRAFRVEPHYTTRTNKPDPELGVQSMSPWFERGAVHVPWGDAHSQRKLGPLVDELVQYPGRTTDTVMAFWFAYRLLQESLPRFGSVNRLRREAPMWDRRISRRVIRNPAYAQRDRS